MKSSCLVFFSVGLVGWKGIFVHLHLALRFCSAENPLNLPNVGTVAIHSHTQLLLHAFFGEILFLFECLPIPKLMLKYLWPLYWQVGFKSLRHHESFRLMNRFSVFIKEA